MSYNGKMKLQTSDLLQIVAAVQGCGGRIFLDSRFVTRLPMAAYMRAAEIKTMALRATDLVFTLDQADWESLPCSVVGVGSQDGDYQCELTSYQELVGAEIAPASPWQDSDLQPCLFLDRDDVVVPDVPYNGDPQEVSLKRGAVELMRQAHDKGWWVVLVTNQSGLGRDKITWAQYRAVQLKLQALLAEQGQWFDDIFWAGFHESARELQGKLWASMRKPRPGMFWEAYWRLGIRFSQSVMVGDSATDLIAAQRAGVKKLFLLKSSKSSGELQVLQEYGQKNTEFSFEIIEDLSIHL